MVISRMISMDKLQMIEEAQSCLDRMQKECDDPDEFDSHLQIFYSITQSILQEINQEIETKPWHIWFENSKENFRVFDFFSDEKNLAYHVITKEFPDIDNPEEPRSETATESLSIIESVIGWIKQLLTPLDNSNPDRNNLSSKKKMNIFHFDNWPGEEKALSICRNYLHEIIQIVQEGQNLAYIS